MVALAKTSSLEEEDSPMEIEEIFLDEDDQGTGSGVPRRQATCHRSTDKSLNPATEYNSKSVASNRKNTENPRKTTENTENPKKSNSNTSLLNSRGWDTSRKQTSTIFAQLEGRNNTHLAIISYRRGLQDSVHHGTSTVDDKEIPLVRIGSGCSRQRSRILFDFEGNRTLTYARQPFPLTVFYNQGTEQDPTNFGLQKYQPIYLVQPFQDGRSACLARNYRAERFLTKIELKDAYIVVSIHPESRKYLLFLHKGTIYQYKSLAFGLSVAPRAFSKLMCHALEPLRAAGIRLVNYLDNICVLAKSKEETRTYSQMVLQQLAKLGF